MATSTLSLLIVAKAKMNNGLCYMGYDANTNRLVRPLYSAEKDKQCWPRGNDFFVGETIIFTVNCAYPGGNSLPHSTEDILVNSVVIRSNPPSALLPKAMFETLFKFSSPTVGAIFGIQNILEDSFVSEGTACPSVGIYSCYGATITEYISRYGSKRRCTIREAFKVYDFPVTAEDSYLQPKGDDSVLLLLGLARPWLKPGQPEPTKRCYILVIGMITKPSDLNMSQVDQLTASLSTTTLGSKPV